MKIENVQAIQIKAMGHGSRKFCRTDKYGFPTTHRTRKAMFLGFQTGDIVKADIPKGKFAGRQVGRLSAVRQRPSFTLNGFDVHPKHLMRIHRCDGFNYQMKTVGRPRETRKAIAHLHCAAGGGGSFIAPMEQTHSEDINE